MSVTPVNGNMLKTAVADAVKGEIYEVQAVDIKFFDLEGKEIEPEIPIRVSIVPGLSQYEGKNTKVVHIDKTGAAEVIEKATDAETENDREIVFDTDSFSIYSVVFTDEDNQDYLSTDEMLPVPERPTLLRASSTTHAGEKELKVLKHWKDKNGDAIEDPEVAHVTLQLKRYTKPLETITVSET